MAEKEGESPFARVPALALPDGPLPLCFLPSPPPRSPLSLALLPAHPSPSEAFSAPLTIATCPVSLRHHLPTCCPAGPSRPLASVSPHLPAVPQLTLGLSPSRGAVVGRLAVTVKDTDSGVEPFGLSLNLRLPLFVV